MRKSTTLPVVTAAVLALLALTGCGGDTESAADTETTPEASASATEDAAPMPSETPSETAAAAVAGDIAYTPQGTVLAFGEKAIVPFTSMGITGAIGVTAVAITAGVEADLAVLELGEAATGYVPYYVMFEVTNESGTDFAYTSLGNAGGVLPDGTGAQPVSVFGTFAPCDEVTAEKDFITVGASYMTCKLTVAQAGTSVVGADYSRYDSTVNAEGTDYGEEPIVWK
jgi:hypothetical protein